MFRLHNDEMGSHPRQGRRAKWTERMAWHSVSHGRQPNKIRQAALYFPRYARPHGLQRFPNSARDKLLEPVRRSTGPLTHSTKRPQGKGRARQRESSTKLDPSL